MTTGLLFDASSMVYLLKLRRLRLAHGNYIQWLTVYEVINALWKEAALVGSIRVEVARPPSLPPDAGGPARR